jgi:CheY-like chemotaxis protein
LRGYDVRVANGGAEALAILAAEHDFDAILCDLMMPGVDGPAVHEAVAALAPRLADRIVFCTGGVFTSRARRFVGRIANPVLDKPVSATALRSAIEAMLAP